MLQFRIMQSPVACNANLVPHQNWSPGLKLILLPTHYNFQPPSLCSHSGVHVTISFCYSRYGGDLGYFRQRCSAISKMLHAPPGALLQSFTANFYDTTGQIYNNNNANFHCWSFKLHPLLLLFSWGGGLKLAAITVP